MTATVIDLSSYRRRRALDASGFRRPDARMSALDAIYAGLGLIVFCGLVMSGTLWFLKELPL